MKYIIKNKHQDNLKAELYHQIKIRKMRCEVELEYTESGSRFDAIIYCGDEIVAIIEVRKLNVQSPPKLTGRKHLKYEKFNVPILYISSFDEIEFVLKQIYKLIRPYKRLYQL